MELEKWLQTAFVLGAGLGSLMAYWKHGRRPLRQKEIIERLARELLPPDELDTVGRPIRDDGGHTAADRDRIWDAIRRVDERLLQGEQRMNLLQHGAENAHAERLKIIGAIHDLAGQVRRLDSRVGRRSSDGDAIFEDGDPRRVP